MIITLLRHALAVERGDPRYPDDRDRPLTGKGRDKLDKVLDLLKKSGDNPEVIYSSPYVRCQQTAQRASQVLGAPLHFLDALMPGGQFENMAPALREWEHVMIVGHEPDLSELTCWLCTGQRGNWLHYKKSGACRLQGTAPNHMRLEWLVTPKFA